MIDKLKEEIILRSLNEDLLPKGDITTECIIPDKHRSSFELIVNENAILSGIEVFKSTILVLDDSVHVEVSFKDGEELQSGTLVAKVTGSTVSILKAERTALNFISHLSGIATCTRKLVDRIKHTKTVLLDTRKTTPGLRSFEKDAVTAGGGKNHRFNLSEMILIKDNHIDSASGVKDAILKAKNAYGNKYKIEVEVRNTDELKEAVLLKPDVIMLDNWDMKEIRGAVKLIPKDILIEVSGQITLDNIKDYAEAGVNYISTSYMIKNSKWIDFSLSTAC